MTMREDKHEIALRAIRNLLGGARPFELEVHTTKVACSVASLPAEPWPTALTELTEATHGSWPAGVAVDCLWTGGACRLLVHPFRWSGGKYARDLCVSIHSEPGRELVFINVSQRVQRAGDAPRTKLPIRFYVTQRKAGMTPDLVEALNTGLRNVLEASRTPILGTSQAELCEVAIPSGEVLPSPVAAFTRLVQLALLKLDFVDRARTRERGAPLVDLGSWLTADRLEMALAEGDGHDQAPPEEDEADETSPPTLHATSAPEHLGSGAANAPMVPSIDAKFADLPLNLILYGPPGTGKTHYLTDQLVPRFQRQPLPVDLDAELAATLAWWELTALALDDLGGRAKVAALEQHVLIKARYAMSPLRAPLAQRLWAVLQSHTIEDSKTVRYAKRTGEPLFDKDEGSTWRLALPLPDHLLALARKRKAPTQIAPIMDYTFVTFHQAYGYEDFIEGIRPVIDSPDDEAGGALGYTLEAGAFLKAVQAALRLAHYDGSLDDLCRLGRDERRAVFFNAPRYAVFIDEINRGNVARIFGELITLLEDDKRLGAEHEVIVQIPHGQRLFGVPPNLHVIGTMNTADRSIDALDTALRRRFEFREMSPRLDLLDFEIDGGIRPDELLRAINHRLERLYDRDHRIGHAYLYKLRRTPTMEGLRRVFRNQLIPLLQEYFYGDWGKIGLVLGKGFVGRRAGASVALAPFDHDDVGMLSERPVWELTDLDQLNNLAFQRIYKDVPDA
jgi:AAA domain (dynein-related subfamily)